MFKTYFDNTQVALMVAGLVLYSLSLLLHHGKREMLTIAFLILAALCINMFSTLLDPFLNVWDERFHALVGKNLMEHPLKPTLYNDAVVNMPYDRWDRYHIWLHKQPMFLWQIALSFKIFGVHEWAMRLPNAILGAFCVAAIYRSGKLLVNKNTGFIAASLFLSSFYLIEMLAGRQELDQNDYAFMAYVTLSIWCFLEYYFCKKKIWFILTPLFAGMAVLCKWLPGLLVFLIWGIASLQTYKTNFSSYKDIGVAILICLLVFLPWQILSYSWYPQEFLLGMDTISSHFTKALDGHSGSFWYHFDRFGIMYGSLAAFALVPGLAIIFKKSHDKKPVIAIIAAVIFVYLFFSFAATKMPSFTIILVLPVFIAIAASIDFLIQKTTNFFSSNSALFKIVFEIALLFMVISRFDVEKLQEKHTLWSNDNYLTRVAVANKLTFQSLNLPKNAVIFNVPGRHYIEAMFYTGLPAYNFIPDRQQYVETKSKGRIVAIFVSPQSPLPDYLENDLEIIRIEKQIYQFD